MTYDLYVISITVKHSGNEMHYCIKIRFLQEIGGADSIDHMKKSMLRYVEDIDWSKCMKNTKFQNHKIISLFDVIFFFYFRTMTNTFKEGKGGKKAFEGSSLYHII